MRPLSRAVSMILVPLEGSGSHVFVMLVRGALALRRNLVVAGSWLVRTTAGHGPADLAASSICFGQILRNQVLRERQRQRHCGEQQCKQAGMQLDRGQSCQQRWRVAWPTCNSMFIHSSPVAGRSHLGCLSVLWPSAREIVVCHGLVEHGFSRLYCISLRTAGVGL